MVAHQAQFARTFALEAALRSRNSDANQIIARRNLPGLRLSKPRCAPGPSSSGRSSRVCDHLTGEVERFAPSTRPRAAGWCARRSRSSSGESVMEMFVDVSASRAVALTKGHSGRLLALEPMPRAACRGIDKQARSPRRLLEQPTEATHRLNPIRWITWLSESPRNLGV